jgi:hypothetical protein
LFIIVAALFGELFGREKLIVKGVDVPKWEARAQG